MPRPMMPRPTNPMRDVMEVVFTARGKKDNVFLHVFSVLHYLIAQLSLAGFSSALVAKAKISLLIEI
jgi:hypothetical protein